VPLGFLTEVFDLMNIYRAAGENVLFPDTQENIQNQCNFTPALKQASPNSK
jgi:hypothetical protein